VAIESLILVLSYLRREQEELRHLELLSSEVLIPSLQTGTTEHKSIQDMLGIAASLLRSDSVIMGGALYNAKGEKLGVFGREFPRIPPETMKEEGVIRHRFWKQERYDVLWTNVKEQGGYMLAVRHDISDLGSNMLWYVIRIGGLVLLISVFVTLVTILVLGQILIKPILYLRDDLLASGEAIGQDQDPDFYTFSLHRQDELGEVATAFLDMFQRIHQEVRERKQAESALLIEQEKSERLLLNVLPAQIVTQLKESPGIIATRCQEVTVLFADIVNFTGLAAQMQPADLVEQLNAIFSAFDTLSEQYGLEKIKTIGDAYMAVGGLPVPLADHAEAVLAMAIDMLGGISRFRRQDGDLFQLRIGIHTGPVVAGVIGLKKFSYDLWGDTVNVASRLESHGKAGKIQVSETTYALLKDKHCFERRDKINLKGWGEMQPYFWNGRLSQQGSLPCPGL
jgi:class 3 adenylate cyclase